MWNPQLLRGKTSGIKWNSRLHGFQMPGVQTDMLGPDETMTAGHMQQLW